MFRIAAVAHNTFREAVRDRVLYGVLGLATAVLVFTLVLAEVSLDQQRRIVLDVGLASISMFSVLVAIFLGSSLLYKEIERKTLYVILPKPIHRHEFLLGKYFGIVITALVFISIMGAVQLLVTAVQAEASLGIVLGTTAVLPTMLGLLVWKTRDPSAIVLPWALVALGAAALVLRTTDVALGPIAAALILNMAEVVMLTAVALFFSAFSTPFLTAMFSFGVWMVGRSADTMVTMKTDTIPEGVKAVMRQLVGIWPNFNLFVPGRHTLEHEITEVAGPLSYVANNVTYAVAYSFVVLTLAAMIFQKRDFL